MGMHASQLMGYEQIMNSIDLITTNSAKTMHIEDNYGIKVGNDANMVVLDGPDAYEVIRKQASVTHSIRKGKVIAKTQPSKTSVMFEEELNVNFER